MSPLGRILLSICTTDSMSYLVVKKSIVVAIAYKLNITITKAFHHATVLGIWLE